MDFEDCRHLTVVGLHDSGPSITADILWRLKSSAVTNAISQVLLRAAFTCYNGRYAMHKKKKKKKARQT